MTLTLPHLPRALATATLSSALAVGVVASDARPTSSTILDGSTAVASAPASNGIAAVYRPSPQAKHLMDYINGERGKRGMKPYKYNAKLGGVALNWSRSMSRTQKLKHNPRLGKQVSSYRWVGENVGYGPSIPTLHRAFMRSPGHRANVLDRDYTQVGVASVTDSKGRIWVTVVFRHPR